MPFDYASYKKKCDSLTTEELQLEWQNYTRQLSSGATLSASSVLLSPLTSGISLIGLGISVPQLHNARKKRAIVGNKMKSYGVGPRTRRRDVIIPAAISMTASGLTFGLTPTGAELIGGEVGVKGIEYVVTHATLDAMWAILDEAQNTFHHKRSKSKLKRMQNQQRKYLAKDVAKLDEYSKIGLDIKRPYLLEEGNNYSRPVRRGLRPYHIEEEEEDYFFDRDQAPPPAYTKKYVYNGGQVQFSYDSRPNSAHSSSYNNNKPLPRICNRRSDYSNSGPAIENLGLLRSSAASRRSSIHHEKSRAAMVRLPAYYPTASNNSRNNPTAAYYQNEKKSKDESDFDSEDEISDQEEDEGNESDEDSDDEYEDEKKSDGKVIEHVLTLEQEIIMLKATILRMEMERRGLTTDSENEIIQPKKKQ
ncbi:hypothetical protein OnM2_017066 [Erysiphe neolycopersici]|uniref:Uncharacterized protein n=1 Tax=Erysiphe neolycopersici TaxID=212602 RepID=A0A420I4U8_9PEZI|nr:hypothetical protein OnM2_017066 [Erysiphe neolycopersici]